MTTLIVGCGYLGERIGRLLVGRGERVRGTVRSEERASVLAGQGIELFVADVLRPDTLAALPAVEQAIYCVGYNRRAGQSMHSVYVDGLQNALESLSARVTKRLVYTSTTGVYGQDDGGWVDEHSRTEPRHESGRLALEAEQSLFERAAECGVEAVIVRLAGLYGPGRIVRRAQLVRAEPIVGDPDKYLNLIHIEDAAQAVLAALERGERGELYLACDNRPVTRREYYSLVAELLGVGPPRFVAPPAGSLEAGRDASNKRVRNERMKRELGVVLNYADITTGLPAALAAEGDGGPAVPPPGSLLR